MKYILSLIVFISIATYSITFIKNRKIKNNSYTLSSDNSFLACKPLADQGDAEAQAKVALAYQYGIGVAQDYGLALKYYTSAADQGYPAAQIKLGNMYENGIGVKQDYKLAFKYLKLAAEQGHTDPLAALQSKN